jgi:tetratricopeptide (TPR) repeat protein
MVFKKIPAPFHTLSPHRLKGHLHGRPAIILCSAIWVCKFLLCCQKESGSATGSGKKEETTMNMEDLKQEQEFVEQGNRFDSQGKYEKAVAAYDSALAIVPEDADVIFNKGETLAKLGKIPEAMKCFDTATAMYVGEV